MMGKRFMANLHASLDSTWKSRISIISTRCQNLEWGSIQQLFILKSEMNLKIFPIWGCFIPQLLILNSEMKDLHWYLVWLSCNIKHITPISNLHYQQKREYINILKWPSDDGKKVYGKFACIIGQYMEKQNFHYLNQMSEPGVGVHSTTFHPEVRNEFKNFSNLGVLHSTTFDLELRNERFPLISFMALLQY